jgi:hypothetical protein
VHILSNGIINPHIILEELVKQKIPILERRGARNNKKILEKIALNGPLLKYDVCLQMKLPQSHYGTISRRIDDLHKKNYLGEAGTRETKRGTQIEQTQYGLTWRGLIASLSMEKVRLNLLDVLEKQPLLAFPEKGFVLLIIEEIFSQDELDNLVTSFLIGYLNTIPQTIEKIDDGELLMSIFPAITEASKIHSARQNPIENEKIKDLTKLLDNPKILNYVKERILPFIAQYEKQLYEMYTAFHLLNTIGQYISTLKVEDKPSEKIKDYFRKIRSLDSIEELEELSKDSGAVVKE